jgi:aminopeptidase N
VVAVVVGMVVALVASLLVWRAVDGDGTASAPAGTLKPADAAGPAASAPTASTAPTASSRPGSGAGDEPVAGAPGVGDPYFPTLGNGGYDVEHYLLELTYDDDDGRLDGTATITARATATLDTFHLDLDGMEVDAVEVDGAPAAFDRDGAELVVDPGRPVARDRRFTVVVAYGGEPEQRTIPGLGAPIGWIETGEGAYTLSEPDAAQTWFPANDHPVDRATFTIELTVRDPLVVVASGRLVEQRPAEDGRSTAWVWEAADPTATYLLQLAVGDFELEESTTADGLPLRSAYSRAVAGPGRAAAGRSGPMIDYLESVLGPFPFETYGVLVPADASPFVAFESQTLSLIPPALADDDEILVHELAHQWVGDSVGLARWADIWLNEGFATYLEWLWADHDGRSLDSRVEAAYVQVDGMAAAPATRDPGAERLFDPVVYQRGALTLHALRLEVGDPTFFDILREWATRFRHDTVTTDDFVALAEELSGEELDALFAAWLDDAALPPRPR